MLPGPIDVLEAVIDEVHGRSGVERVLGDLVGDSEGGDEVCCGGFAGCDGAFCDRGWKGWRDVDVRVIWAGFEIAFLNG